MLWHRCIDAVNMVYQIVSYLANSSSSCILVIQNIWDDLNTRLAPLIPTCKLPLFNPLMHPERPKGPSESKGLKWIPTLGIYANKADRSLKYKSKI